MATVHVNKSNNLLVFFNQYRQLCVYDKTNTTTGRYIPHTFVLLRQMASNVQRWVSIKRDDTNLIFECFNTSPDPDEYAFEDYDFSDNAGQLWYDDTNNPAIVIGTGDIRDGIAGTSKVHWYTIPHRISEPTSDIIIECVSPFLLRIHHKNRPVQTDNTVFENSCQIV